MCISIGHLSALCQEIVSPLSNWESDTLGNTQIRRPLWERTAFSRSNWPYPSDIPADGSANGSSPREKFLGTSENTRWKLRWVEEVGPQPESRAIANAKWLRDNFCLSSSLLLRGATAAFFWLLLRRFTGFIKSLGTTLSIYFGILLQLQQCWVLGLSAWQGTTAARTAYCPIKPHTLFAASSQDPWTMWTRGKWRRMDGPELRKQTKAWKTMRSAHRLSSSRKSTACLRPNFPWSQTR